MTPELTALIARAGGASRALNTLATHVPMQGTNKTLLRRAQSTVHDLASALEALSAELDQEREAAFALSADQCEGGYGDEHGNHRCTLVDEASARAAALSAELERVTRERDRIVAAIRVKGGDEHSPTMDAYLLACEAIRKHRARAKAAEAEVAKLREAVEPSFSKAGKHAASLAAGWQVNIVRADGGARTFWSTDQRGLVDDLSNDLSPGDLVFSIIPVAALRQTEGTKG